MIRQLSLFALAGDVFRPEKFFSRGEVIPADSKGIQRVAVVENTPLCYQLVRSRRKTLCLRIIRGEVIACAPMRMPLSDIDAFVTRKGGWIQRTLEQRQRFLQKYGFEGALFRDHGIIPFRGRKICLRLTSGVGTFLRSEDDETILCLGLGKGASESEIREAVLTWIVREAERVIAERYLVVLARAPRPAVHWRLSNAQSQWGSCSADGSIRFSWRLIFFDDEVIDYVIAHELAHRVHMNHSRAFWLTVESIKPDYRQARARLKGVIIRELPL